MTMRTRWFSALTISIVAALVSVGPVAAANVDVDHVSLGSLGKGHVSYGKVSGNPAEIDWSIRQAGPPKVYRAQTQGQMWVQGPNASMLCARLKVIYLDKNANVLATQHSSANQRVCLAANTGGSGRGIFPFYYDSSKVRKVRIVLQQAGSAAGPWTKVAQKTCSLHTTDCA